MSITIADASGHVQVTLYHDVAATLPFLPDDATQEPALRKMVRAFRAPLWSMRVVFRMNEFRLDNYVEVKKMVHTITSEGVVATYRGGLPPGVREAGGACPVARCADIDFDADLGVLRVRRREVDAASILVTFVNIEEDE